ncbi:MAG TPA: type II CAAX endopeptidase family protein [Acidimicrobiales bacterium]|nr:type II CAAX endopeptidase family protein [Acidimicrobiales bacterium]
MSDPTGAPGPGPPLDDHPTPESTEGEKPLFPGPRSSSWAILLAIAGFLVGSVISAILVAIVAAGAGIRITRGQPADVPIVVIANLVGLWVGLLGATVLASHRWGTGHTGRDFGLRLRLWPDLPLGLVVGLGSQFVLIPLIYLPFRPFFPNLTKILARPAQTITGQAHGGWLVALALFIAVGAPIVEELFFRGLLLRALDRRLAGLGRRLGPAAAVVLTGVAFGLAHGEGWILAVGLGVFGAVLAAMAEIFDRLGPSIVAHGAFNASTVAALALVHPH